MLTPVQLCVSYNNPARTCRIQSAATKYVILDAIVSPSFFLVLMYVCQSAMGYIGRTQAV